MELNLKDNWHKLSAATRQWLIDNPGSVILPRTLVTTIREETGLSPERDQHGETTLSGEDRNFIRAQVNPDLPTGPEPHFFDTTRP